MDEKLRRRQQEDELGADIIDECRVQLMLKFRFLDRALWRMPLEPVRAGANYPLATNGSKLAYDPPRVIGRFKQDLDESIRDYLHMVLHCIFRHPYNRDHDDREAWNLTCDVIAESVAMDLCAGRFPSEQDAARQEALSMIKLLAGDIVPSKVYGLMRNLVQTPEGQQYRSLTRGALAEWHALFERDEHAAWPANNDQFDDSGEGSYESDQPQGQDAPDPNVNDHDMQVEGEGSIPPEDLPESMQQQLQEMQQEQEQDQPDQGEASQGGADAEDTIDDGQQPEHEQQASDPMGNFSDGETREQEQRDEEEWEDISKQIEMNLETFSKEWGDEAASFMTNLAVANRKRYDYSEFLRRFAAQSEEMLINPDEFDYVYYTYGLDLYGNMPLVEPLEYKETDRVRDFVIAIDTSESVRGELVRQFVRHTFDMLKDGSQDFASDVNIHVVQADNRVQQDMVIRSLKDVDALIERFQVRGFGGTDFRPVFDYVQGMRDDGKLNDMRGLIYFTDGLGTFPEKAPDFDAAFVFMENESQPTPSVPPWAIKLIVDEQSFEEGT